MKQTFRIFRAWFLAVSGIQKKKANKRLKICIECSKQIKNKIGVPVCGVCGCPIFAKVNDIDEGCPHPKGAKW